MIDAQMVKLIVVGSIVLIVLATGLGTRPAELAGALRRPRLALKTAAAMFLAMPLVATILTMPLPVPMAARVLLLAFYVSPTPPIFPGKGVRLGGTDNYVMSLFAGAAILSLGAAPVGLWLGARVLGVPMPFDAGAMARTIALTILLPLGAGVGLAALAPAVAGRLEMPIRRIGTATLAIGVMLILFGALPGILAVLGDGTALGITLVVAAGLALGHALGASDPDNRATLATAMALRHPGVAIALATAALPREAPTILATALLFLLINTLAGIVYGRLVRRTA